MTGTINLYNIYYGKYDKVNPDTNTIVNDFSANIGNSSWYKIVSENYFQINADNSTTYAAKNISLVKSVNSINAGLTAGSKPVLLTNKDFTDLIVSYFNINKLPIDTNGIYAIIFRGDFTVNLDGQYWLTDWCGYHGTFVLNDGRTIKYLVVGDINTAITGNLLHCALFLGTESVNRNPGADTIVSNYAHELAEIITDWDSAWYCDECALNPQSAGPEIGDVCSFQFGVDLSKVNWNIQVGTRKYLVQNIWRPGFGCVHTCC